MVKRNINRIKLYDKISVGEIYSTHRYGDYIVLNKTKQEWYLIEFIKTGYKTEKQITSLKYGAVKDKLFPSICGIACIGDGKYHSKINNVQTDEYRTWQNMIDRCYNPKTKSYRFYGQRGVKVDERWHNFQNFCEDIKELENYDKWKTKENGHEWTIDKDLKQIGVENKIYSKDTCIFLTMEEQTDLSSSKRVTAYVNGVKLKDFKSANVAGKELNTFCHHILDCCNLKIPSSGKYNNIPIVWRYTDDLNSNVEYNNNRHRSVVGFVDGIKIFQFKTIKEAILNTGASESGIIKCCKGIGKYSGKYNNKIIVWKYLEEGETYE